jgi:hypothetical protein
VDDAVALSRLREELGRLVTGAQPYDAPCTRACLQRIGFAEQLSIAAQ